MNSPTPPIFQQERWNRHLRLLKLLSLFVFSLALLIACQPNEIVNNGNLKIVATTGMLADAITIIGGDKVEIQALMGPGVDPHLYKASQGDLEKLKQANLIVYNGLHLEGKMAEVLERMSRYKNSIAAADGIAPENLLVADDNSGTLDPHIWFDVQRWKEVVTFLNKKLQQLDTTNAAYYQKNTTNYLIQLDTLDEWVRAEINSIPDAQRVLITAHDAFGYFGKAYGIEVRGLQGLSTLSEFGLRDVKDLVDFITERSIKAVFVETSVSEKALNAVIEGCKQRSNPVLIGGALYSDAMGEQGTPEGNYIGMVKANVNTIVAALK